MPKVRSLDFVLLESAIFGLNQGYTGRFVGPRITWVMGIFNCCTTVTVAYFIFTAEFSDADDQLSANYIARRVYFSTMLVVTTVIQIRYLLRRRKTVSVGRELYGLYQSSTWNGDIYGCIARIVLHLGWFVLYNFSPIYAKDRDGKMNSFLQDTFYSWSNFALAAAIEFIGQAMLLVQYEFEVLSEIAKGMAKRKDFGMGKLRALNRRHASLFALFNKVARFNGMDSMLIIESERFFILISILIQVNFYTLVSLPWSKKLVNCGFFVHRIERIAHYCFRGHRIIVEAKRFASTLDEIDPLDLESEELFTELQIFRKQVRLRRLQFDCNHFLKLDMRLFCHISKDLLAILIILVQLTTNSPIVASKGGNMTEADNITEYSLGFSDK